MNPRIEHAAGRSQLVRNLRHGMLSGSDQTSGHALLPTSTVVGVRGGPRRHPAATGCRYCLPGGSGRECEAGFSRVPAAALPSSQRSTEGALRCEPTAGCTTPSMPTVSFAWGTAATRIGAGFSRGSPTRPHPRGVFYQVNRVEVAQSPCGSRPSEDHRKSRPDYTFLFGELPRGDSRSDRTVGKLTRDLALCLVAASEVAG